MKKTTSKSAKEFHSEQFLCWMCMLLERQQVGQTQRHHIAGRGRKHDVRANYAALCQRCHGAIQSVTAAEIVCLVLKWKYDPDHYDPALICELRGWAKTWITDADVDRCERIMGMMCEVTR